MITLLDSNEVMDVHGGGQCICHMVVASSCCAGACFLGCCGPDTKEDSRVFEVPSIEMCAFKCKLISQEYASSAYTSEAYTFNGVRYDL